jgi:hypothetical protein
MLFDLMVTSMSFPVFQPVCRDEELWFRDTRISRVESHSFPGSVLRVDTS